MKYGWWALVVITIASLALWGGLRGLPGIWGVLLGAAVGGGFVLATALSVLMTSNTTPATTVAVVLGGWLVKIMVLLVVLFIIRHMYFYDHVAMFVTVLCALVAVLATEVWGIVTSNVTYTS